MTQSNIESIAQAAQKITEENKRQSKILDELLHERQQMLVCFCELAGLESSESEIDVDAVLAKLKSLNQLLVDYSALGHFEIYNRITDGKERRESIVKVASEVYGDIERTTELFIAFNDKYDGADSEDSVTTLYEDLSEIGECLALRIDGEDKLLAELVRSAS